jgi:hypothetical protein
VICFNPLSYFPLPTTTLALAFTTELTIGELKLNHLNTLSFEIFRKLIHGYGFDITKENAVTFSDLIKV